MDSAEGEMKYVRDILDYVNRNRPLMYFNVVLLFFLVNGLASRIGWRVDLSRDRINSLSDSTEKVLDRLEDPVLVEAYISKEVPGEILSMLHPVISQLEEIARQGGDTIRLRMTNPTSEEQMKRAEERGIRGIPIEEAKVDEIKQRLGFFGIYMQMGEKTAVLNLVQEGRIIEDLEYRFLRELKRMTRKERSGWIGFARIAGGSETAQWTRYTDQRKDNLYGFRTLAEEDFGVLEDVDLAGSISPGIRLLIVTGLPRMGDVERYHLDQFILRGGNVVFLLKGFDFQMQESDPRLAQLGIGSPGGGYATVPEKELRDLNEWLGSYGITVNGEILFEPENAVAASDIEGKYVVPVSNPAWAVYSVENGDIFPDPVTGRIEQLVFPWFSGLQIDRTHQKQVDYRVLVSTTESAIRRTVSGLDLRELRRVGSDPGDTAVMERVPVAVLAKGKFMSYFNPEEIPKGVDASLFRQAQVGGTESLMAVVGTPYMVSDLLLRSDQNAQIFRLNIAFLLNLIEGISGDTDLLDARSRVRRLDTMIPFDPEVETFFKWFFTLTIPGALAIYGAFRIAGRTRKRGLEGETEAK
jgi:ABC-type uncharacterized transport system involved in gliding motility auxiliary subunit